MLFITEKYGTNKNAHSRPIMASSVVLLDFMVGYLQAIQAKMNFVSLNFLNVCCYLTIASFKLYCPHKTSFNTLNLKLFPNNFINSLWRRKVNWTYFHRSRCSLSTEILTKTEICASVCYNIRKNILDLHVSTPPSVGWTVRQMGPPTERTTGHRVLATITCSFIREVNRHIAFMKW